jgi:hypothetical protein
MIAYYGEHYADDKTTGERQCHESCNIYRLVSQGHIDIIRCGTKRVAFLTIFFCCTACGGGWLVS